MIACRAVGAAVAAVVLAAGLAQASAGRAEAAATKLKCPISSVSLKADRGAIVRNGSGSALGHSLPFGEEVEVTGGGATVSFRDVTYTLASGSRFYTLCYTPSNRARGLIPMLALPDGKDGVTRATILAARNAPGEYGAIADRLAGIGKAGQSWSLTVDGPATAKYSTSATEAVEKGGPVQAVVPRDTGQLTHAKLYELHDGHSLTVTGHQHVNDRRTDGPRRGVTAR